MICFINKKNQYILCAKRKKNILNNLWKNLKWKTKNFKSNAEAVEITKKEKEKLNKKIYLEILDTYAAGVQFIF